MTACRQPSTSPNEFKRLWSLKKKKVCVCIAYIIMRPQHCNYNSKISECISEAYNPEIIMEVQSEE